MWRLIRILCVGFLSLFWCNNINAQGMKDPTTWTYEAKKTANNEYTLTFNLKLDKGFHIWSLKPGGDGFQVIPSFIFEENLNVAFIGKIEEQGKLITETMEGIEGKVNYFSNEVKYSQKIKAPAGTIIKGMHEYQVCNDVMCLPPTAQSFIFTLK